MPDTLTHEPQTEPRTRPKTAHATALESRVAGAGVSRRRQRPRGRAARRSRRDGARGLDARRGRDPRAGGPLAGRGHVQGELARHAALLRHARSRPAEDQLAPPGRSGADEHRRSGRAGELHPLRRAALSRARDGARAARTTARASTCRRRCSRERRRRARRIARRGAGVAPIFHTTRERLLETAPPSRGIAYDDGAADCLDNRELKRVLATAHRVLGRKVDVVGMDACLMTMIEVAYQLRDHARVLVGSEEVEPGPGWPHAAILGDLTKRPAMTRGRAGRHHRAALRRVLPARRRRARRSQRSTSSQLGDLVEAVDRRSPAPAGRRLKSDGRRRTDPLPRARAHAAVLRRPLRGPAPPGRESGHRHRHGPRSPMPAATCSGCIDGDEARARSSPRGMSGAAMAPARGLSIYFPLALDRAAFYRELDFASATRWATSSRPFLGAGRTLTRADERGQRGLGGGRRLVTCASARASSEVREDADAVSRGYGGARVASRARSLRTRPRPWLRCAARGGRRGPPQVGPLRRDDRRGRPLHGGARRSPAAPERPARRQGPARPRLPVRRRLARHPDAAPRRVRPLQALPAGQRRPGPHDPLLPARGHAAPALHPGAGARGPGRSDGAAPDHRGREEGAQGEPGRPRLRRGGRALELAEPAAGRSPTSTASTGWSARR